MILKGSFFALNFVRKSVILSAFQVSVFHDVLSVFFKKSGVHTHTPLATFYVFFLKNLGECMQNSGDAFVMFYVKFFKNLGNMFPYAHNQHFICS